jgi:hypothetical protein
MPALFFYLGEDVFMYKIKVQKGTGLRCSHDFWIFFSRTDVFSANFPGYIFLLQKNTRQ